MIVDFRLDRVFKEVQAELETEGIKVSTDLIEKVVDSQFESIRIGMEQMDKIVCPYLGTFDIKKRTKFAYEQHKTLGIESHLTNRVDNKIKKINFSGLQIRKRESGS